MNVIDPTPIELLLSPGKQPRTIKRDDAMVAKACIQSAVAFLIKIGVFRSVILQALEGAVEKMAKRVRG